MTIDSSFIECFKNEAPHAFTPVPPFHPGAVFCDGQIRLMRPNSADEPIQSWDSYVRRQFVQAVQRYLSKGVECVIVAFDDYNHVPQAKSMTQLKRRRHLPPVQIYERDPLPPVVPSGQYWMQCIANRTFKGKVIDYVIHRLPQMLQFAGNQQLIIDYQETPTIYSNAHPAGKQVQGWAPLGEADVKFVRYTGMYSNLQVDSIDGDNIPIALLYMESGGTADISVLRMLTKTEDDRLAAKEKKAKNPEADNSKADKQPRVYEYVHIRALYSTLVNTVFPQCVQRVALPSHRGHEISMLVSLIGLAGTDFTRGLPMVSGKTLYEYLPGIWLKLARSYDPESRALRPDAALDCLVAAIYHRKYHGHTSDSRLDTVLAEIRASRLSERTKALMPDRATLHCTVRNINWLLRYWREQQFPDPVSDQWGFVRRKGIVGFEH